MWEFPVQVKEATEFLKRHEKDIETIVAFPNVEAALDFGIELKRDFLNCDYLPPELLRLAGNLGIGIELSHYAPTEEEDQIKEHS